MDVITYQCWDQSYSMLAKGTTGGLAVSGVTAILVECLPSWQHVGNQRTIKFVRFVIGKTKINFMYDLQSRFVFMPWRRDTGQVLYISLMQG